MSGDVIAFFVFSIICIFASVMVMEARKVFHAALYLALLFAAIAGIYILLTAEFIAAIQVLIYAGAVVVLILFAIVLTRHQKDKTEISMKGLMLRIALVVGFIIILLQPLLKTPWPADLIQFPSLNTYSIGYSLFTDYVIPFEVVSLALLAALIGAVYISRREVHE